jgi:hypothetical protein
MQNQTAGVKTADLNEEAVKVGKSLRVPPALPVALNEWHRFLKSERTINDLVEDGHRALLDDGDQAELYRSFLFAVYDEQAVEGSLAADNIESARMIREWAKENKSMELAHEKLATIAKALGVVLRRYHASRKERRQMVGGEVIPGDSGD